MKVVISKKLALEFFREHLENNNRTEASTANEIRVWKVLEKMSEDSTIGYEEAVTAAYGEFSERSKENFRKNFRDKLEIEFSDVSLGLRELKGLAEKRFQFEALESKFKTAFNAGVLQSARMSARGERVDQGSLTIEPGKKKQVAVFKGTCERDSLDECIAQIKHGLDDAKWFEVHELDEVPASRGEFVFAVLVGSELMPKGFQERVVGLFGEENVARVDPQDSDSALETAHEMAKRAKNRQNYSPKVKEEYRTDQGAVRVTNLSDLSSLIEAKTGTSSMAATLEFTDGSKPYLIILGEYGIGKTTLCRHFAKEFCEKNTRRQAIYLDLKDLKLDRNAPLPDRDEILKKLLEGSFEQNPLKILTARDLVHKVQDDQWICIFDGLDEQLVHMDSNQSVEFIRELWKVLPPGSPSKGKLIFSLRSSYFPTLAKVEGFLTAGGRAKVLEASDYTALVLLPFTEEQILDYLEHELGEKAKGAMETIRSIHNLTDLSKRGVLLSLISGQIEALERKKASGETVLAADLYELFVAKWFDRDEGKHHLSEWDKYQLMVALAAHMWKLGRKSLEWQQVESWLRKKFETDFYLSIKMRNGELKPDRAVEDFHTATLVLRPDASESDFQFAHTSIQEFFLAKALVNDLVERDGSELWTADMAVNDEVLGFVAELLSKIPDAARAVRNLIERNPKMGLPLLRLQAQLAKRRLAQLSLTGLRVEGADLREIALDGSANTLADFSELEFVGCNLATALRDFSVKDAVLTDCALGSGNWLRVDLTNTKFINCAHKALVIDERIGDRTASSELLPDAFFLDEGAPPDGQGELLLNIGHGRAVSSVAFDRSGSRIVSGSYDRTVKVWDAVTGACLQTLEGHGDYVTSVAIDGNGSRIVSGSDDRTVKVWDAFTGACLQTLEGHGDSVKSVAIDGNGSRIVSGSYDRTVKVWDAVTGACLQTLEGHSDLVKCVAFDRSGSRIVSGSWDNTAKVWDAVTGACLQTLVGHGDTVISVAFDRSGSRIVSGCADSTVKVWDAETGDCLQIVEGQGTHFDVAFFDPSRSHIISEIDDMVFVWDTKTGACLDAYTIDTIPKKLRQMVDHEKITLNQRRGLKVGTSIQQLDDDGKVTREYAHGREGMVCIDRVNNRILWHEGRLHSLVQVYADGRLYGVPKEWILG